MRVLLFLTVVFAIAAVVYGENDNQLKKRDDRSHHEKQQNRQPPTGRYIKWMTESPVTKSKGLISTVFCNAKQKRVCANYNCVDLTCANYDDEVGNWGRCMFENDNNFNNLKPCKRISFDTTTRCICNFGLVLDEETGLCVRQSNCKAVNAADPSTTA